MFTKVVRPVPEAPNEHWNETVCQHSRAGQRKRVQKRQRRTDDHDGELDTLLDFVSSASTGERHGCNYDAVV